MPQPLLNTSERRVIDELERALSHKHRWRVAIQVRAIDVLRAAAPHMRNATLRGNTDGLQKGDINRAFMSHFDFVVLDGDARPLLAVEFDGPRHDTPEQAARDAAKNRLCLDAGLPLLRINDAMPMQVERTRLVEWVVAQWAERLHAIPALERERDRDIAELGSAGLWDDNGPFMPTEYPHLDTELVFRLTHPFPPSLDTALRLHDKHRLHVLDFSHFLRNDRRPHERCRGAVLDVVAAADTPRTIADCRAVVTVAGEPIAEGRHRSAATYPLRDPGHGSVPGLAGHEDIFGGLPAGPWPGAAHTLTRELAGCNALAAAERTLDAE